MKRLIPLLTLLAYSAYSHATLVSIQADEYAYGTPITSDYVRLISVDNFQELPVYRGTDSIQGFSQLVSGRSSGYTTNNIGNNQIQYGLLFEFTDAVDSLDIEVFNTYGRQLWVDTFIFAADGSRINVRPAPLYADPYQLTTLHFDFGDQAAKRFYVGGGDQINLVYFTGLSFNVPEPGTLGLLTAGCAAALFVRRRRIGTELRA